MPKIDVNALLKYKKELEGIQEEHIRAQERHKSSLEVLSELGFDSISKAEIGLTDLEKRRERVAGKAQGEFDTFIEEYGELFE